MIRGIFFDCFGVLYVDISKAYFARFPQHDEALTNLNIQADHGFIDRQTYITAVAQITGRSEEETVEGFAKENTLNRPLIEWIKKDIKPYYKVGLISNIGRGWIQDFFDEHQLHDLFDVVVLSAEEGITKPNPLLFERAAERIGIYTDESVFIDDRQENCLGAETTGMKSLLYESNEKLTRDLAELVSREQVGVSYEN